MKRLCAWLLCLFLLSVCPGAPAESPEQPGPLVVYFSATGTTRAVAQQVAQYLGADLLEIEPEVPYTAEDLAYYTGGRCDQEQDDPAVRPGMRSTAIEMDRYDTVLIGYPIWHGQAPRIIQTFLESYDFAGKTLAVFCTSHSSGLGSSETILHASVSDTVRWLSGRRFPSGASGEEIRDWLDSIGLTPAAPVTGVLDLESRTVLLNSGYTMPVLGLGTYALDHETCIQSVMSLIENGGRLIDTAYMYGNEEAVGEGVRRAMAAYGVSREEIFVITKLYPSQFSEPEKAMDMALEKLDLGYIDMMLLHHPGAGDVQAWLAMERYVEEGRIRSLGLSNWYVEELTEFLPQVHIPPALVQNEIHPYYQEKDVVPFIQGKGMAVQCWYPLGGRGYTRELLTDPTIVEIAQAHQVSAAQVILRWDLQRGVVVIPGSSNPEHIRENLDLFGFELTDAEMERMAALDRGEKHDWY